MIVLTLIRRGTVERSRCKQLIHWMSTPFFAHLTIRPKPVVQHLGSRPRQTASKDASPLLLTAWHRSIIIFACVSLVFRKHHLSENSSQQRQPFNISNVAFSAESCVDQLDEKVRFTPFGDSFEKTWKKAGQLGCNVVRGDLAGSLPSRKLPK